MPKTYSCQINVRGYELDSFGHVNHAVYVSYLEHARWEIFTEEEISLQKLAEWKAWPVIAAIEVKYLKPTYMGDRLVIETQCVEHGRSHFSVAHLIRRGEEEVLRAKVQVVMVNEKGRPTPIPPAMACLWGDGASGPGEGARGGA